MASHIASRLSSCRIGLQWRAFSVVGKSALNSALSLQAERYPSRRWASGVGRLLKWLSGDVKENKAPPKLDRTDFGNCGVAMGVPIPQPGIVVEEGVEKQSKEWSVQLYGAALYWHMASTVKGTYEPKNENQFRNCDVLEVGCALGGGARYLAQVAGPRTYVATDINEECVAICRSRESKSPGLQFGYADAMQLNEVFPAGSFDFVLAVQVVVDLGDGIASFFSGAAHVLRPRGRLIFCDMLTESEQKKIAGLLEKAGFSVVASNDISTKVRPTGLCHIHFSREYRHIIAEKLASSADTDGSA